MSARREQRIKSLFVAALDRDTAERPTYLATACEGDTALRAEVEALLDADRARGDFLQQPATDLLHAPLFADGDRVGRYRIVRRIGAGGGGTVYEALQEQPHRKVALKTMRFLPGTRDALERFHEEAEILARLRHPAIAHVYEAGVHERTPYIALEYVDRARPLVEAADERGLDRRTRVALLAQVCDAVHHGHQRGVVHRDLKPANVLVDGDGRVKVIDFGIAQLEGGAGRDVLGTIPFASPEQCAGTPVDVRTDVYALGVLLHETLTGGHPHDLAGLSSAEAADRIRDRETPEPPRSLGADLRAILRRALARDPERRYASAAALADDLRRHLDHRPVEAHPPTLAYQWRKFARRQRVVFAAILAVVTVSIAGAIVAGRLALAHDRERRVAEWQAYRANLAAASAALRVHDVSEARQRLTAAQPEHRGWEWRHLAGRLDLSERTIHWRDGSLDPGVVGRTLLATGFDPESRVWDIATGTVVAAFGMKGTYPLALDFSPDETLLAAGGRSGRLELRGARDAAVVRTLRESGPRVLSLDFSPDGNTLAEASRDGRVRLWDVASGALRATLSGHTDRVIAVAWAPDGARLASGGREGVVRIWEAGSGASHAVLEGHEASVEDVAWSPDGARLVSGSRDHSVRLWQVDPPRQLAVRRAHAGNVRKVAFSPDGATFASGSWDRTVRLWEAATAREVACLRGHEGLVVGLGYAEGGRVVSFARDGTIKFWRVAADDATLLDHRDIVSAVAYDAGGRLVSVSADGTLRTWGERPRRIDLERGPIEALCVAGDTATVVARDGSLVQLRLEDGSQTWTRAAPAAPPTCVALDPAGRFGLRSGERFELIRLDDGAVVATREPPGIVTVAAFDPSGRGGALATRRGELRRFPDDGARRPIDWTPRSLRFAPSGRLLVAGGADGEIRLLDARTLATRARLPGHADAVTALEFLPDATRLVSGGLDGTVRLWSLEPRGQVLVLRGHRFAVRCLAVRRDGAQLASGDGSGEDALSAIRLWDSR